MEAVPCRVSASGLQAFVPPEPYDCVDLFSGKRAISKAYIAQGKRACSLDFAHDEKDEVQAEDQNNGRLDTGCLVKKLDKSKFEKSTSTRQYQNADGEVKFQGTPNLVDTQVYPPKFGRKVCKVFTNYASSPSWPQHVDHTPDSWNDAKILACKRFVRVGTQIFWKGLSTHRDLNVYDCHHMKHPRSYHF
ncbi:unnamed protein product [Cladocopium goreaui]|uniref:Uncharacterized protein n=1 Tax=Cladocopium goreaui TaxID=2562237 RepID=A0A9P1DNY9_9DINO|nr:unnamed protein product [Cladocopium goreaui]